VTPVADCECVHSHVLQGSSHHPRPRQDEAEVHIPREGWELRRKVGLAEPSPSPNLRGVEGGLPDTPELKVCSGVTGRDTLRGELVVGAPCRERVEEVGELAYLVLGPVQGPIPYALLGE
jgi:hypothetical protein